MMKVSVSGTDALSRRLNVLEKDIRKAALHGLETGADRIAKDARARVKTTSGDTGALENSIETRVDPRTLTVTVEATAPHAAFVEYGTVHQAARPFMTPALEENRAAVADDVARAVTEALKKFNR